MCGTCYGRLDAGQTAQSPSERGGGSGGGGDGPINTVMDTDGADGGGDAFGSLFSEMSLALFKHRSGFSGPKTHNHTFKYVSFLIELNNDEGMCSIRASHASYRCDSITNWPSTD